MTHEHTPHGYSHQEHAHESWHFEGPEEVERITRDGEVALPFVQHVLDAVRDAGEGEREITRVLDIGPGSGVHTVELARLLPDAHIIALEPSISMGAAISDRAAAEGVEDRVEIRRGELPGGLIGVEDIDLVWASMSLHHVPDEVAALKEIGEVLSDGGVVALVERGEPNQVLPADLGTEGLADRLNAAYSDFFDNMRHGLDGEVESGDLADMVTEAGFAVSSDELQDVTHEPPLSDDQRAFVAAWTGRTLGQLNDALDEADLEVLREYVDDPNRADGPLVISRRVLLATQV